MQLVTLEFKALNLDETVKQKKAVYTTETATHIVASTKSFNNLVEDYQKENKAPTSTTRKDLFLDKTATETAVDNLVNAQIKDTETAKLVAEYVKKVLDGGCVYYKPIIRKK